MSTDTNRNTEFGQRVFSQFMELFVTPAVKERQSKGDLPKPFPLHAAQIIFFPDGSKPIVRVNEEVKAIGQVKLKDGILKAEGDALYANEIEGLEKIKLVEDEFPDCGHATLMKFNNTWTIAFDFRYNKDYSIKHLDTAAEFYESGHTAFEKGHWSAFVDNLFSACELAAKAILLSIQNKDFRDKATHKGIHSRFNRFASLGNVKEDHKDVFNRLHIIRGKARYLKGELALSNDEATQMLTAVKELIEYARSRATTW